MLNWNTPEMTIECVNSVLASKYQNFKINVIDNGSKDDSFSLIKAAFNNKISIFKIENNIGYAMGMNYALEKAADQSPDYILIMNNDTVISEYAISHLVDAARRYKNKCVVTGKIYHFNDKNRLQTVGSKFKNSKILSEKIGYNEIDVGQYDEERVRDMIDDIFMLLPLMIYKKTCGFSPCFFMNYEQTDLVLRIKKLGYQAIYTPKAKLWHKGSFSTGGIGNPYMMFWEGKSRVIINRLHLDQTEFLKYYISDFRKICWTLLKGIIGSMLGITKNLDSRIALFRGLMSGTLWLFNQKDETGYNPYSL